MTSKYEGYLKDQMFVNVFLLKIFGTWPPLDAPSSRIKYLYLIWQILFMGSTFWTYLTFEFIYMYTVMGNLEQLVEASFLLLTHFPQTLKHFVYCYQAKRIQNLHDYLGNPYFIPITIPDIKVVDSVLFRKHVDTYLALIGCSFTVLLWVIRPYFIPERELALKTWFPVQDMFTTPTYQLLYVYQTFTLFVIGWHDCAEETYVTGMIGQACVQMDLLSEKIKKLDVGSKEFKGNLDQCIRHHLLVKRFVEEIQSIFHWNIFAQFSASVITICLTGFQLTVVVPGSAEFASMLLYLAAMLFQVYIYCWHGNEILIRNSSLSDAIYQIEWEKLDRGLRKDLWFFLYHAQRPIAVRIGKFFILSTELFTNVLKSSYQYFALLQQMKDQ